jgi:hypothetical protein
MPTENSLYGLIGFSSKLSEVESGLYLDSLPDVSLTLLDKLTADGDNDFTDLWTRIEDRSIKKFRTLFINAINKCHKIHNIEVCECLIESNYLVFSIALWYLMGAELMFERYNSSRLNKYTTIDRPKAKELNTAFMEMFTDELTVGVNSIDVNDNECSDEIQQETNLITVAYAIP